MFSIEVTTNSKNPGFPIGFNIWRNAFGIAVKASPIEGKANKDIIALIAETLKIQKNTVTIISGHTSTIKKVKISGISREDILTLFQKAERD
ncbi:DUF167 domain-containing protein [Methanospirillum stamsii]|uniref:DUF167 domain-containing protein n=1 Tax=Methanospirillum stamsii TaxID=1277351 RepID=UPI0034E09D50